MSWKKKPYKPIDIDEPIDVQIYKPVHRPNTREKSMQRIEQKKLEAAKRLELSKQKKLKGKRYKKGVLIIDDYMKWLHGEYSIKMGHPIDVHHWMPKSRISHNDFFVCCISKEKHHEIHHGGGTVNGFIEEVGIENLLVDSAIMFASWLATEEAKRNRFFRHYYAMIQEIQKNPTDFEYVLGITRQYAEEIRQERIHGRQN